MSNRLAKGEGMKSATIKAFKASIAHWRRLASGRRKANEEPLATDCALCQRFTLLASCRRTHHGERCPLYATKICNDGGAYGIAFKVWCFHHEDSPEFRAAAQKMVDALVARLKKVVKT